MPGVDSLGTCIDLVSPLGDAKWGMEPLGLVVGLKGSFLLFFGLKEWEELFVSHISAYFDSGTSPI